MTDQSQRHPSRLVYASVLFVLLNALGAAAWLSRAALGHTLAHWTGETELRCQLRGAASLLWQKATQRTPRTDPLVPIAHTGVSPYGVNTFLQLEVEPAKVERSLRLASEAGFRFIRHDVSEYVYVDGPLDGVLHFASPASPADYLELPIQMNRPGFLGGSKP